MATLVISSDKLTSSGYTMSAPHETSTLRRPPAKPTTLPVKPHTLPAKFLSHTSAAHLQDYYTDLPQAWLHSFKSAFAISCVVQSLMKFHWAVSKLPSSFIDTIGALCEDQPSLPTHTQSCRTSCCKSKA